MNARRAESSGWWGMALLVATEATLFGCLIATYFYLRFDSTSWPQGGIEKPAVALPLALTAMLVAACAPVASAVRAAKDGRTRRAWWLLALATAVQGAYLGLQLSLFVGDLDSFSPQQNAYASIYFALLGVHHAHVAIGLALDAWLLAVLLGGLTSYRLIALRVTALYWYFVSAVAVLVVLTQLYPSL
jgi:heme/copper-type cytochrome/quinol oxidase subunit 3